MANFNTPLKKIAVMTSGGDAPGMNAAIRAVVRSAILKKLEVVGILGGFPGLLDGRFQPLTARSMANILQRGGTVLKTGRAPEFLKPDVRTKAAQIIKKEAIDAIVCIGGDGSFKGCHALWAEHAVPVIGIPGTIDNDINGTDKTIGFDTAVNTAVEAIDRIRDTAASHDRLFIVEVMGRDSGFLALSIGVAGGAEEIFTPEFPVTVDKAVDRVKAAVQNGKTSSIIITAEGQKPGRAYDLAEQIRKRAGYEAKVCILGHQQRGGSPSAADRLLASRLGVASIEVLISKQCDLMVATEGERIVTVPLETATAQRRAATREWIDLAHLLAQ